MKRRNIISIAVICLCLISILFTSCNSDATDRTKCYEQVQIRYPKSTIFRLPKNDFTFIVIDTCGKVMYVETMSNKTPEVTIELVVKDCR